MDKKIINPKRKEENHPNNEYKNNHKKLCSIYYYKNKEYMQKLSVENQQLESEMKKCLMENERLRAINAKWEQTYLLNTMQYHDIIILLTILLFYYIHILGITMNNSIIMSSKQNIIKKSFLSNSSITKRIINSNWLCVKLTGNSSQEVISLHDVIKSNNYLCNNSYKLRKTRSDCRISLMTKLLITLVWIRNYPIIPMLSALFGVYHMTITKILSRMVPILAKYLNKYITWPDIEEIEKIRAIWNPKLGEYLKDGIFVVDGTEFTITRPSKRAFQKISYSGKKKQFSLNVLFVCLLNGEIVFKTPYVKGAQDQREWNFFKLRNFFIRKQFGILGDSGFTFNPMNVVKNNSELNIIGYTIKKKKKGGELTEEEKHYNSRLSQFRCVIETSIAEVKKYKILSHKYRHFSMQKRNTISFNDIVTICTGLANIKIKKTPLRNDDWEPKTKQKSNPNFQSVVT